ncbi:MAG TPA: DNA alkylation repair protein [Bacteroidales bacterium]|nr:DNA alkylation repair protein [Bacteroidales bacterium]HPF03796.1 DNA alkylation repair protein [Bacteroidales bacterium]HPJ59638.1 DNA alkylation repair protein [Bacteroidales bacterium]HPR10951.1 DNA alkylation repair protein [Bacteroidales bacterium]HRW85822.1 DNA alkylation repair protein [Bacteroidales bacterium]
MSEIVKKIRAELVRFSDEKTRKQGEYYFKEEVKIHGLKSAQVEKISREYFRKLPDKNKSEIFILCEELFKSGYLEEAGIACMWSYNIRNQYMPGDFEVFENWVARYVTNWATCDTLCNHNVGTFLMMYPSSLKDLKKWALAPGRWMKRASAVSLIVPARKGLFLDDIFEIADILHSDTDDMVQKGYGWMLKAASQAHQMEVFSYVMQRKKTMPRTALRYAIEKLPAELKSLAMAKQ